MKETGDNLVLEVRSGKVIDAHLLKKDGSRIALSEVGEADGCPVRHYKVCYDEQGKTVCFCAKSAPIAVAPIVN